MAMDDSRTIISWSTPHTMFNPPSTIEEVWDHCLENTWLHPTITKYTGNYSSSSHMYEDSVSLNGADDVFNSAFPVLLRELPECDFISVSMWTDVFDDRKLDFVKERIIVILSRETGEAIAGTILGSEVRKFKTTIESLV